MKKISIAFHLAIFNLLAIAQPLDQFEAANSFYRNGEFHKSIEMYNAIIAGGKVSSNLYYNLGNAYYKNNQLAKAILFYERALIFDPGDDEIIQNLRIARHATIDRFERMPKPIFKSIWLSIIQSLSPSTWTWLAVIFLTVFVTSSGFYLFSSYKRSAFTMAFCNLTIGILNISFGWAHHNYKLNHKPALIIPASSYVKSGPSQQAEDVFILHEGTKLEIIEPFEDWQKIRLPDGKMGWIEAKNVQEI